MAKYLVTFSDNHNEEFDVNGFQTMTDKEYSEFEKLALEITWEFEYKANNESLVFINGEDFLARIELKEITNQQFETIEKIFGGEFGTFIGMEFIESIIHDESDDFDDSPDDLFDEDEDEDY